MTRCEEKIRYRTAVGAVAAQAAAMIPLARVAQPEEIAEWV